MDRKVSVIIPNYNYARFLQRRVNCIVNQTIKPAEIIFLDDCSSDDSLKIAEEILSKTDIPYQIIANETNQGVFKQWLKGIELIQHDYFWIAEADDYCELNFLETLLPAFDDKDVVISYCQSKIVNQDGLFIANESDYKAKFFDANRWLNSFVNSGIDEVQNYLCIQNTIPNASALLMNKSLLDSEKIIQSTQYKMCGDWMFYIQALLSKNTNKISYNSVCLNHFVRHEKSVFGNHDSKLLLNQEFYRLYYFILLQIRVSEQLKQKIFIEAMKNFFWFPENSDTLEHLIRLTEKLGFSLDLLQIKKYVYSDLKSYNTWLEGQVENYKLALNQKEDELVNIKSSRWYKLGTKLGLFK